MSAPAPNLSSLVHACREAMAHGWKVELVMKAGGSVVGVITRMPQNQELRADALKAAANTRSQMQAEIDGMLVDIENVRALKPRL